MYLYEAKQRTFTGETYRFWSKSPYVLHNYTIHTEGGASYNGNGYETEESCIAAARRELRKWDGHDVAATAWYTEHVERVEVSS